MARTYSRTIHGTTDSSQVYSKGAKSEALKNSNASLPQPTSFPHLSLQPTTNTNPTVTPNPIIPQPPAYDPFSFAAHSNEISSLPTTSPVDPSFTGPPIDADNTHLDPQLLALQPSPLRMLPTPFITVDHNQLPAAMDQSPESLNLGTPFTYDDFTFFDELDNILGILNPTRDLQAQLDQLITSVVPSGVPTPWTSTANTNYLPDVRRLADPSFRMPASNEVPIKGVYSASPPNRNIDKKLDETAWKALLNKVQIAETVSSISTRLTLGNNGTKRI